MSLRHPLAAVLFQRGAFDSHATQSVVILVGWYGVAFIPASRVHLLSYAFFAIQEPTTLAKIVFLTLLATGALDLLLWRELRYAGIAPAYLCVPALAASALGYGLRGRVLTPDLAAIAQWIIRIGDGLAAMFAIVAVGKMALEPFYSWPHYDRILLLVTAPAACLAYLATITRLGILEGRTLLMETRKLVAGISGHRIAGSFSR